MDIFRMIYMEKQWNIKDMEYINVIHWKQWNIVDLFNMKYIDTIHWKTMEYYGSILYQIY